MALTKVDDRGLKTPIDLQDNEKIRLGTGNDLQIYHTGSHSFIENSGTGNLIIESQNTTGIRGGVVNLTNVAGNANLLVATAGGSAELYYDNGKRLETVGYGTHTIGQTTAVVHNLYTGGTKRAGLRADNSNTFTITDEQGHNFFLGQKDAQVELYHDNSKKLETTSTGVLTTGNTSTTGAFVSTQTGGGVLSDNLSLVDNKKVKLGDGDDIEIYHNGTHSYLENNTGTFYIRAKAGENSVTAYPDGGVKLAYDDNTKFETTSAGVLVSGNVYANDNNKFIAGTSNDLQIYHDGSHSYIKDAGTGTLRIEASEVGILSADGSETMAQFVQNGATSLRYDNSKKFETTSTGVTVTGTVTATTFSGDGIIPAGGIIIWSGASNAIPTGWLLCDGSNSTPDLRDRFVVGAGSTYSVGATGGSDSVTLTTAQIPSHTHSIQIRTGLDDNNFSFNQGFSSDAPTSGGTFNSNSTGGGGSHENRPPYYALCYIMKS